MELLLHAVQMLGFRVWGLGRSCLLLMYVEYVLYTIALVYVSSVLTGGKAASPGGKNKLQHMRWRRQLKQQALQEQRVRVPVR